MLMDPFTKYIILYNFDLNGGSINIPQDSILCIDGGNISNGTLVGNNTILLNPNGVDVLTDNITFLGTWKKEYAPSLSENMALISNKSYNPLLFSG